MLLQPHCYYLTMWLLRRGERKEYVLAIMCVSVACYVRVFVCRGKFAFRFMKELKGTQQFVFVCCEGFVIFVKKLW